jgi:acyl-CoA synthetase (AMP-forming)/AMP-acid ligase II
LLVGELNLSNIVTTEVSTLGDLLLRGCDLHPERDALVLPAQKATYSDLYRGAVRLARALLSIGVRPQDRVAILIPNCVEYAESLLGIAMLGCVPVPLNTRLKPVELGFIIRDAQVVALLTSRHADDPVDFPGLLREALDGDPPPYLKHRLLVRGGREPGFMDGESFLDCSQDVTVERVDEARRRVRIRQAALIIYTSGTTANPKGCVLSHEAATRGPVERARYRLKAAVPDVTWGAGPLFHIGTLAPFIGSLGVAGTFLADTYFDPGRALELMYQRGVTLAWPWFPAIVQGLIGHESFDSKKLKSLRHLVLIASPTLVDEVQAVLPQCEVLQGCGMTETGGIFAISGPDEQRTSRSNTQGKPVPGVEVRIVNPQTEEDCPQGAIGEIWVRGYNVMEGYWAAPELTQKAITADGWLKTGDLYTQLENGSLIFGGRYKDMLKVGGENVSAVEVEVFLCTHPAVKTAEVVGRPDPRLDEVPVAYVELKQGYDVDGTALIEHCRGRIANYKVPRAIYFMEPGAWPMSATKIDKRALRAMLPKAAPG